jgi:CRP-like cAMP-binding protein
MSQILRQQIERITALTDEEFEYILSHFTKKKFKKNEFLIREKEPAPYFFFVLSGCLKAYHLNSEGKESIIQFALQDWWISDYQSHFNEVNATINVDCIEDAEVLCLTLHNREKLCDEMHKMERFFRKKSNAGYAALQNRILSMLNNNPKERYEKLLIQNPTLFQKVPKTLIASYLGVSRETLSRFNKSPKRKL